MITDRDPDGDPVIPEHEEGPVDCCNVKDDVPHEWTSGKIEGLRDSHCPNYNGGDEHTST